MTAYEASDAGRSRTAPPLKFPEPYSRVQFVVFAYWTDAGWWRREGDYADEAAAQRVADAHNEQGRAVMVARQVVTFGVLEPLTGASGATAAASSQTPGGAS